MYETTAAVSPNNSLAVIRNLGLQSRVTMCYQKNWGSLMVLGLTNKGI